MSFEKTLREISKTLVLTPYNVMHEIMDSYPYLKYQEMSIYPKTLPWFNDVLHEEDMIQAIDGSDFVRCKEEARMFIDYSQIFHNKKESPVLQRYIKTQKKIIEKEYTIVISNSNRYTKL